MVSIRFSLPFDINKIKRRKRERFGPYECTDQPKRKLSGNFNFTRKKMKGAVKQSYQERGGMEGRNVNGGNAMEHIIQ